MRCVENWGRPHYGDEFLHKESGFMHQSAIEGLPLNTGSKTAIKPLDTIQLFP